MALSGLDGLVAGASAVYVTVSPTAVTAADFPLRGYAGPSGRLDVVARALVAPLRLEPDAVSVAVLLGPPRPPLVVAGLRGCLGARERSAITAIRRLMLGRPLEGCATARVGLEELLHYLSKRGFTLVYLREGGADASSATAAFCGRAAYIAGAHVDIPGHLERVVERAASYKVSLSPTSLLTSHVHAFTAWLRLLVRHMGVCGQTPPRAPRPSGG